jgi:hypothetical protein
MTPESLVRTLEEFLASARDAQVIEDGAVVFDFADAKYSVSGEHNKCLLHFWSAERNVVRRVLDAQIKNDVLRFLVQRLGQSKPTKIEICRQRDGRTASAKHQHRLTYARTLKIIIGRHFSEYTITDLRTSMDLERSFGPIYTRGLIKRGQSAFALIGINHEESQASVDAILSFAHSMARSVPPCSGRAMRGGRREDRSAWGFQPGSRAHGLPLASSGQGGTVRIESARALQLSALILQIAETLQLGWCNSLNPRQPMSGFPRQSPAFAN